MSGVKDGDECYYYVDKNHHVVLYTDDKDLKTKNKSSADNVKDLAYSNDNK